MTPTSALDQRTRDEIVSLCIRAFGEQEFVDMFELVEQSLGPTHVMARLDGRLVSHAVWSVRTIFTPDDRTLKTAYIDAVATDPDVQGRGFGSAVIQRLNHEIRDFDIGCLSTDRVNFYLTNGWELWTGPQGVKTEAGVRPSSVESVMIRRTARTPPLNPLGMLAIEPRPGGTW